MKKVKKLAIISHQGYWRQNKPFKTEKVRNFYENFSDQAIKKNLKIYKTSIDYYDKKNNNFKKAWFYKNKKWHKITKPLKADIVMDRTNGMNDWEMYKLLREINSLIPVYNNPNFRRLINNKLNQFLLFSDCMPKTKLVSNKIELLKKMKQIKSKKIVVKPIYGSGGKNIKITKKENLLNEKIKYPKIIQEFVDGSRGIPGQTEKQISDLRIFYLNHKPQYALIRMAQNGSLLTNLTFGAKVKLIPLSKVPKNINDLVKKIIPKIKIFKPSHYSLDFMFNRAGKPFLIELNPTPGFGIFNLINNDNAKIKHIDSLIDYLNQN